MKIKMTEEQFKEKIEREIREKFFTLKEGGYPPEYFIKKNIDLSPGIQLKAINKIFVSMEKEGLIVTEGGVCGE
ncbi:MAG: hypothetical protein AMQ74_01986 [Candidatus Methanofastidiosum methylothiophilum]|uniref:Uncharacterized protein n=1 Tax=Candidatus Methanofastidiosum methylothiophilum TaxID=1705564 RepID=A0A150IH87_9EURY|nr:MAG: hypothetical protein AMQ74_01986 [Candidatus Methanofastidiosum methylthiophilus]